MPRLSTLLRWLAIPAVIAGVVTGCFAIARWATTQIDARCEAMVGGACVEGWHTGAVEGVIYLAVVVGVALIVLLSSWIAPAGRRAVALVAGLIAIAPGMAGYLMTRWGDLVAPILVSLAIAALCIAWVWLRHRPAPKET